MQELKPFHVEHRTPLHVTAPDLTKAEEVKPFLFFGALPHAGAAKGLDVRPNVGPVVKEEKKEVESTAGLSDPKVTDKSAIDSASPSGQGTSESGTQVIQTENPIHPSILSDQPVIPVSVVKEPTLPPPPL